MQVSMCGRVWPFGAHSGARSRDGKSHLCTRQLSNIGQDQLNPVDLIADFGPKVNVTAVDAGGRTERHWRQFRVRSTCLRRISTANIGPHLVHQNLTVSCLLSMPRFRGKSSRFRSGIGSDRPSLSSSTKRGCKKLFCKEKDLAEPRRDQQPRSEQLTRQSSSDNASLPILGV